MALYDFYSSLLLNRPVIEKDPLGSYAEGLKAITEFKGAITAETTNNKRVGDKLTPSSVYTLTTSKKVQINFGDIITFDNISYRVLSDSKQTPKSANLDIKQYLMEIIKV